MLVSIKKSEPPLPTSSLMFLRAGFLRLTTTCASWRQLCSKRAAVSHYCHQLSFSPIASSPTAGKIWSLIERFDRCAAVPCDSALIRWRSIAVVPSKIQDFAEFDGLTAGFHLFVKVPDSWPRIKDHLQAEGNECSRHFRWGAARAHASLSISARDKVCASERAEASAGTYFNVTHLKLSLWL